MSKKHEAYKQNPTDLAAAGVVLAFTALISLFAIRNNDVWWLLAVARRIVETKAFIFEDPFTFTAAGALWAPQAYLSALVFYAVYQAASAAGLIVLRALLVLGIFMVSFRTLARLGVSWAIAAPFVLLVLLNAHSRFIVRAHLFEYLLLVFLLGFLLTAHRHKGRSFFVFPVVTQLLWVNMHPSYMLGPALVVLFFAGEWLGSVLSKRGVFIKPLHQGVYEWKRVGLLVALMAAACFVNPAPGLFLSQPLGAEQRELVSHFTLEWRSPFDPALRIGAFHPYYEILLGTAALSILAAVTRLPLAPALLVAATAVLSLQAHRFRVEFALVSLPMMFLLFEASPVVDRIRKRIKKAGAKAALFIPLAALALAAVLIVTALDRVSIGPAVEERYPDAAFDFIKKENIAQRPFHTIAFGSYLLWDLYGERRSFIDGRNFSLEVYRDFLACQSSAAGARAVAEKYRLDAFILPPQEVADAGISNVHNFLAAEEGWTLVYLDGRAWVYVKNASVDAGWLAENGYKIYHPLILRRLPMDDALAKQLSEEIRRAVAAAPDYLQSRLDLALVYTVVGEDSLALATMEAASELEPENAVVWNRIGNSALAVGDFPRSIAAFRRLYQLTPGNPVSALNLGRAYAAAGERQPAVTALEEALSLNPGFIEAYELLFEIHAADRYWEDVRALGTRMTAQLPGEYRGFYYRAVAGAAMGRRSEALQQAQAALQRNDRAVDVYILVANIYAQEQDYNRSLDYVNRALSVAPENRAALEMRERLRSVQP